MHSFIYKQKSKPTNSDVCVYVYIYTHVYPCLFKYVLMPVHTWVCMYILYLCMYVFTCMYNYVGYRKKNLAYAIESQKIRHTHRKSRVIIHFLSRRLTANQTRCCLGSIPADTISCGDSALHPERSFCVALWRVVCQSATDPKWLRTLVLRPILCLLHATYAAFSAWHQKCNDPKLETPSILSVWSHCLSEPWASARSRSEHWYCWVQLDHATAVVYRQHCLTRQQCIKGILGHR